MTRSDKMRVMYVVNPSRLSELRHWIIWKMRKDEKYIAEGNRLLDELHNLKDKFADMSVDDKWLWMEVAKLEAKVDKFLEK